jgi:hypothetical protein
MVGRGQVPEDVATGAEAFQQFVGDKVAALCTSAAKAALSFFIS